MSTNGNTRFRPFADDENVPPISWRGRIAAFLLTILITAVSVAVSAAVAWVALVWLGDFNLSLANVMGIGLLWWIADLGLRQGLRDMLRREAQ